tara:strand:- start:12769 stop:13002 length:234 start_codon:yes stop_codon:yes gene_type:complete
MNINQKLQHFKNKFQPQDDQFIPVMDNIILHADTKAYHYSYDDLPCEEHSIDRGVKHDGIIHTKPVKYKSPVAVPFN